METARFNGKKAQIIDLLYMGMILLMLAILGLIMYKVITDVSDQFAADDAIDAEYRAYTDNYKTKLPNMLQQLFMIVLIGVAIVTMVASFMVRSHPIFYGLMIIVLAFMTWVNAIYANFWQEFAADTAWSSLATEMPMINYIMEYFPLVMLVISLIIVIVMVAKGD